MSVVYFVQAGDGGPIKIGVTRHFGRRLKMLQTGCPQELIVLATVNGGQALEAAFHIQLAQHRMRSEWFHPASDVLAAVDAAKNGITPMVAAIAVVAPAAGNSASRQWRVWDVAA